VLAEALREVLGVDWQVETVGGGAAAPSPAADVATTEGFEPGDAPVDTTEDPDVAADGSERGSDDAISLLTEGLGARVIGEVDAG